MKVRNKKTGEIGKLSIGCKSLSKRNLYVISNRVYEYVTLADLFDEWEDYKEPKYFWYIDVECGVMCDSTDPGLQDKKYPIEFMKSIGNYFSTKEEAEKAIEKLKAWKRLKDKGFRFTGWATNEGIRGVDFEVPDSFFSEHNHSCISDETKDDLDLLLGGKE